MLEAQRLAVPAAQYTDRQCACRYGIPGSGARRFEEVMRMTAPQRFQQDRDLLHHLTTLTPPPLLMNNGELLLTASTERCSHLANAADNASTDNVPCSHCVLQSTLGGLDVKCFAVALQV